MREMQLNFAIKLVKFDFYQLQNKTKYVDVAPYEIFIFTERDLAPYKIT